MYILYILRTVKKRGKDIIEKYYFCKAHKKCIDEYAPRVFSIMFPNF